MNEKGDKQNAGQTNHFGRYPAVSDFVQAIFREYATYADCPVWASSGAACEFLGIQKIPQGADWEVAGVTNYSVTSVTIRYEDKFGPIDSRLETLIQEDMDGDTFDAIMHLVRMLSLAHKHLKVKKVSWKATTEDMVRFRDVRKLLTQLVDSIIPLAYREEFLRYLRNPSGFDQLCHFLVTVGDALGLDHGYGGLLNSELQIIQGFTDEQLDHYLVRRAYDWMM